MFTVFFLRKFVPKIDRKLPEKQVENLQKTSLKLFPSTPKLQINQPGRLVDAGRPRNLDNPDLQSKKEQTD